MDFITGLLFGSAVTLAITRVVTMRELRKAFEAGYEAGQNTDTDK